MHNIVLGDCLNVMPTLPDASADFVLTDPPYLVNYQDRFGRSIANDRDSDWLQPAFAEMYRVLRRNSFAVSFYGWSRVDLFMAAWRAAGFRVVGHLVFAKRYASSTRYVRYQHESAFLLAKGAPPVPSRPIPDVLPWQYTRNTLHPTQKPVTALSPLIQSFTKPGDLVLDPFAGSGSTNEAAFHTGRRSLGIEVDPTYHRAAVARMAALLGGHVRAAA